MLSKEQSGRSVSYTHLDVYKRQAKKNAKNNKIDNAEFYVGKSEEIVPELYKTKGVKPDVMVVDPPRKGCEESLLNLMLQMQPKRIVYVSCDSATLARDLKILCATNEYEIKKVQPVDMSVSYTHLDVYKRQYINCMR